MQWNFIKLNLTGPPEVWCMFWIQHTC